MSQTIESKLTSHDRYQFELKLGYTLNPNLDRNKYNVELYMFIPGSLGINSNSYTKEQFFNDIQGYIRFKTPAFTFDELTDPNNHLSPLTRIKDFLDTTKDRKKLIAELKLFACTVRVALRNEITEIRRKIKKQEFGDLKYYLEKLYSGLKNCLADFRSLKLHDLRIHGDIKTAFRYTDEYIGIAIDGLLNSLHNTIITSYMDEALSKELSSIIAPLIISEFNHRKENNFAVYSLGGENETFLYRKGILKKIITSILFLKTHTQEGMTFAKDIVFAISAGVAMILATGVTLWAGHRYGATSIPFVLAIVVGYMAKDRIKDWLKLIFSKKMTTLFSDYKTDILDPANFAKIGVCKQAFSFLSENKIPSKIMEIRRRNTPSYFWLEENIIKYEKDVFLRPRAILKAHTRMRDVTDIIRFNVRQFLEKMDEPYELRRALNPETHEVREFKFARIYHITMILKLDNEIRKVRMVLNQNGIMRVEEIKD